MALSPWPTTPAALQTAISRLRAAVGAADTITDKRIGGIGAAASAMVEKYAPGAPESLREEAVIRFAGYLAESSFGAIMKEDLGPLSVQHPNHAAMFRNSGAAALLSRWRIRRAGAIG